MGGLYFNLYAYHYIFCFGISKDSFAHMFCHERNHQNVSMKANSNLIEKFLFSPDQQRLKRKFPWCCFGVILLSLNKYFSVGINIRSTSLTHLFPVFSFGAPWEQKTHWNQKGALEKNGYTLSWLRSLSYRNQRLRSWNRFTVTFKVRKNNE